MSRFGEIQRRIGMLLDRRRAATEIDEEMQLHLDLLRQRQIEAGIAPGDAGAQARRRFGNRTRLREQSYDAAGWNWLESLARDLLYGLRGMLRSPGITIVALLSLALGIGANTAIFSLMDSVMLRSLPVKAPQQLLLLGKGDAWGITNSSLRTDLYSYPFYREFAARNHVFSRVAAFFSMHNDVYGSFEGREKEPLQVRLVSGSYFETLGVTALRGRVFRDADDRVEGGDPVVVVSDAWWKRRTGRDPAILNRKIDIGAVTYSIVGIAPPEFFGTTVGESPDLWIPLSMTKSVPPYWDIYNKPLSEAMEIIGRLKPGVPMTEATADVNLLFRQINGSFAGGSPRPRDVDTLQHKQVELTSMGAGLSTLRAEYSEPLKVLMAIAGLVLLIACANIANLLLARSAMRARELAVRQALGAQRSRLIRQLLTESLLIALLGGTLGVFLADAASHLLLRLVSSGPDAIPLYLSLDGRMLSFTSAVTLGTALLFGIVPAFRATRLEWTQSLKDGRGPAGAARSSLATALIVSQVSLSLVLVMASGLFLRSLVNLARIDTGFNKENVLLLNVDPGSVGYTRSDDPRLASLYRQIERRVSGLPGVHAASFSTFTFGEGSWNTSIFVEGYAGTPENNVKHNIVGAGYFAAMGIPLLAGRSFSAQDTATSRKVAIVSESMARKLFPKGSPLGRHYGYGDRAAAKAADSLEVIGVVKDVQQSDIETPADRQMVDYLPLTQSPGYIDDFEVRYSGDFGAVAAAVRHAIHEVDPNLPIANVTTLDEQVARSYTDHRVVAQLSAFFGVLAVFLAAIGIYGLMSYVVSRRTNEIGIRMALGAARAHVRWLVMREVLLLVAIGIAIGVPAALLSSRLVAGMLYGLKSDDPHSLLVAVAAMLLIAAAAGYLPARRASRVDPMVALRYE